MKIKNEKEKTNIFIQDIYQNIKSFLNKIFKYFYLLIKGKKQTK